MGMARRSTLLALVFVAVLSNTTRASAALLISNFETGLVRVDSYTGAFIDAFLPRGSNPTGFVRDIQYGPDGLIYVKSDISIGIDRYDPITGNRLNTAVPGNWSTFIFGTNGHLFAALGNRIFVYDTAGTLLQSFQQIALVGSIGALSFGPDGKLYVGSIAADQGGTANITRYDPATGAYVDEFVARTVEGFEGTGGMAFGPDGKLYVANERFLTQGGYSAGRTVLGVTRTSRPLAG